MNALVDRTLSLLLLLLPAGLAAWALLRSWGAGPKPVSWAVELASLSVILVGSRRPLLTAALLPLAGFLEWIAWTRLATPPPLAAPVGTLLLTGLALLVVESIRPTVPDTSDGDDGEPVFWRIIVMIVPLAAVCMFGFGRAL